MKELNISHTIITKRRKKGLTQEELAAYFGVSKASVSKWETGQSYPDITFLPRMASFFNISIDELLDYKPQMEKDDIRKLYHQLSARFSSEDPHVIYQDCQEIARKYFSCFPLLLQIGGLYINHATFVPDPDLSSQMLLDAASYFRRVKTDSGDALLAKDALLAEAALTLIQNKPQEALDLLGETVSPLTQEYELTAQSWLMLGNPGKAMELLQFSSYQHLIMLVSDSTLLLLQNKDHPQKMQEILHRACGVIDLYHMESLHPSICIGIYISAAEAYSAQNDSKQALYWLGRYVDSLAVIKEFMLHGDSYFDKIDSLLADMALGSSAPCNRQFIQDSLINALTDSPAFTSLHPLPEYQLLVKRLTNLWKE